MYSTLAPLHCLKSRTYTRFPIKESETESQLVSCSLSDWELHKDRDQTRPALFTAVATCLEHGACAGPLAG